MTNLEFLNQAIQDTNVFDPLVPIWKNRENLSEVEKSLLMSLTVASNLIMTSMD